MLYDEEEILRICKKYGIKTVKKNGMPLYKGKEMDENFSIAEIMHEPVVIKDGIWDEILVYVKYLKRKLKLKGEMNVIGSKILFLRTKYWLCQLEMMVIDCKKWVYSKLFKEN